MHWCTGLVLGLALSVSPPDKGALLSLNSTAGCKLSYRDAAQELTVAQGAGETTDGDGSLHLTATVGEREGNQYVGFTVPLAAPVDLTQVRVLVDARTSLLPATQAFYVRLYNQGESKPAMSYNSWSSVLTKEWRTFTLQPRLSLDGLAWEASVVEDRQPTRVDRLEFIIGTAQKKVKMDLFVDNLRVAPPLRSVKDLKAANLLLREVPLVTAGQPVATVLHPDSDAGRQAAAVVVAAVKKQSGATLTARPGTAADRQPSAPAILLGNVDSNPALAVLYARALTPADAICPGPGGSLVHTIADPFGTGGSVVVAGASDDAGLAKAAAALAAQVAQRPAGADLALGRLFLPDYTGEMQRRYAWAMKPAAANRLEEGLKQGQRALDEGMHTSIAGILQSVALRYQLSGHSVEAKLFVALWDLYAKSAVADPRKFGGPWGFDSDFPSFWVVTGWDAIEEDPSLTDAERLRVAQQMARWLAEAVIPKVGGRPNHVPHNHQTFPGLGALMAGLYYSKSYRAVEGTAWLQIADNLFGWQAAYAKPWEDCNGYQWLTNGHLMRYSLARPDLTVFENGNAKKIIDYCLGTMNNLGYQVPYGDTGSWQCWNSEMICLDAYAFVTGDKAAAWAAARKRELKRTFELYSFYRSDPGEKPAKLDGVKLFPLDATYYESWPAEGRPALAHCYDKVAFRERVDPQAPYLLVDGLSNGGHKHLDGNSIPQMTAYDRIWLADNDYFKAQTKYHNSVLIFKDGEATPIPDYAELVGMGETQGYGYCRSRMSGYSGVTWDRAVVWLKGQKAFVVLDRLEAQETNEYQLRLLWHGVGRPTLDGDGLLLEQKGPAMRIDVGPGPKLKVVDDADLGANWSGYAHADPVVRSLNAVAQVQLQKGQSYLFATVIHGDPKGDVKPWKMSYIAGADGVMLATPNGPLAVGMGPVAAETPVGAFSTDAKAIVVDGDGVTLLGAREAGAGGTQVHSSPEPTDVEFPFPDAAGAMAQIPTRPVPTNLSAGGQAAPGRTVWERQPQPDSLVVSGNRGLPGAVNLGVKLTSDPAPAKANVFNEGGPNSAEALLDGDWASNTGTSVMYDPDRTVTLTLDLGRPVAIQQVRWLQWWATSSSKNTRYLLKKATVLLSNDGFQADRRQVGEVTDPGPHPNFGQPLPYRVAVTGQTARYVRWVIEPQKGSAVYLSELLVDGKLPEGGAAVAPYHISRLAAGRLSGGAQADLVVATKEGSLLAFKADGAPLWSVSCPAAINDVTCADVDGDGRDEVVIGRQDFKLTLLSADGKERWSRELKFYRRPPYVNVVRTGDLDGDGRPEIIAGGENWRFYAYKADGTELWNYESVHPSRSGAVADLDGDGKCEVLCGTHYYWFSTLKPDGTQLWGYHFGPIAYDVATGSFDGNRKRGVVIGGGDGFVHYLDSAGKSRLKYNTGDEVRKVACADLDGSGKDQIIAGSLNYNVYCFGADGKRRWRQDVGDEVTALTTIKGLAVVGTAGGKVFAFDAAGKAASVTELGAAVVDVRAFGEDVVVATADGKVRRLAVK